jgi:hypothetical protein
VDFSYNGTFDRVSQITDYAGRTTTYSYDGNDG